MNQGKMTQWGAVIFLVVACLFLGYQRLYKPRLLIIHSYHPQMPWVKSINRGIAKVFGNKAFIARRYFYMNTKYRHSPRYLRHRQQGIENAVTQWHPNVIIAFDYDAQNAVAQLSREARKGSKIIFAGITNAQHLHFFRKNPDITGITEKVPVRAIREILSLIFRNKRNIYYLSDNASAAAPLEKMISDQNWGAFHLVGHKRVKTLAEWKQAVREAGDKADILLVSMYQTLRDGHHKANGPALVDWMNRNATIPVVGMYESFMVDGGLMAIAISSYEQGFNAAQMASQLLEKKASIREMPVLEGKTFSLFIEKKRLKKHFPDIHIPVILDAFAQSQQAQGVKARMPEMG